MRQNYNILTLLQEVGIWGSSQTPKTGKPAYGAQCVPNTGAVPADPYYDNPTYQIFDSSTYELSPPLTLTILLESWPINTYPFVVVLPTGSNLVVAGQSKFLHDLDTCRVSACIQSILRQRRSVQC